MAQEHAAEGARGSSAPKPVGSCTSPPSQEIPASQAFPGVGPEQSLIRGRSEEATTGRRTRASTERTPQTVRRQGCLAAGLLAPWRSGQPNDLKRNPVGVRWHDGFLKIPPARTVYCYSFNYVYCPTIYPVRAPSRIWGTADA